MYTPVTSIVQMNGCSEISTIPILIRLHIVIRLTASSERVFRLMNAVKNAATSPYAAAADASD